MWNIRVMMEQSCWIEGEILINVYSGTAVSIYVKLQNYYLAHMWNIFFKFQPDRPHGLAARIIKLFESKSFLICIFSRRLIWLHLDAFEGTGIAMQLITIMAPGKMVNCVQNKDGTWPVPRSITCESRLAEKLVEPHSTVFVSKPDVSVPGHHCQQL